MAISNERLIEELREACYDKFAGNVSAEEAITGLEQRVALEERIDDKAAEDLPVKGLLSSILDTLTNRKGEMRSFAQGQNVVWVVHATLAPDAFREHETDEFGPYTQESVARRVASQLTNGWQHEEAEVVKYELHEVSRHPWP